MEMSLSQHLVKAYELPTKQARSDTTSFSVYHQISEDFRPLAKVLSRSLYSNIFEDYQLLINN
jgi:hypothetical protein